GSAATAISACATHRPGRLLKPFCGCPPARQHLCSDPTTVCSPIANIRTPFSAKNPLAEAPGTCQPDLASLVLSRAPVNPCGRTPLRAKDPAGRLARSRQEEYVFGHATEPIIPASPIGPLGG